MGSPFAFFVVFIMALILVYHFLFSKKAIVKRKLKNANYRKLSNFRENEIAKIVGHVEIIDEPLISPLAHRKCVHYHVLVEKHRSSGKSTNWYTLIEEEVSQKFLIREDGKYAYINSKNIKKYVVRDKKFSSGFGNDATQRLEAYLKSKGEKSEGFLGFNKSLRYFEGVLEENEKIAVFGKGNWKDASELGLPEKYDRVLEINSEKDQPVYLSDDPDTTTKKEVEKRKLITRA